MLANLATLIGDKLEALSGNLIVMQSGKVIGQKPAGPSRVAPYNLAMVTLDADPRVNFYSNLPGTPPYKVPAGAAVEVTFEEVAPGQLIHEWRVVG